MKVYRFLDTNISKEAGHTGSFRRAHDHHNSAINRNARGADIVEISPEARQRYESIRLLQMGSAGLKPAAGEFIPLKREYDEIPDADPRNLFRTGRVMEVKFAEASGLYDFDKTEVLARATENLLLLVA